MINLYLKIAATSKDIQKMWLNIYIDTLKMYKNMNMKSFTRNISVYSLRQAIVLIKINKCPFPSIANLGNKLNHY